MIKKQIVKKTTSVDKKCNILDIKDLLKLTREYTDMIDKGLFDCLTKDILKIYTYNKEECQRYLWMLLMYIYNDKNIFISKEIGCITFNTDKTKFTMGYPHLWAKMKDKSTRVFHTEDALKWYNVSEQDKAFEEYILGSYKVYLKFIETNKGL